jgi:hypothetical protein
MAINSKASSDSGKRLNLAFPERTIDRMDKMKALTTASSYTDVIKTALLTYQFLVESASKGDQFFVKHSEQDNYIPVIFAFDVEPKKLT